MSRPVRKASRAHRVEFRERTFENESNNVAIRNRATSGFESTNDSGKREMRGC